VLETTVIGISLGCVYALVAVGFSLIYRTTGVMSFAQGAFVMIGGMVGGWLVEEHGLSTPLAIVAGTGAGVLAGLVLAAAVVLPLWRRGASEFVVVLGTLVFLVICENLALNGLGSQPRAIEPFTPGLELSVAGQTIESQVLWVVLATVVISGALYVVLARTRFGTAMRACANDRHTSRLLGISPTLVALGAFGLTAGIGAFAGLLISPIQLAAYSAAQAYNVSGFLAAVVGGLGDVRGAVAGGLLVGLIEAYVGVYVSGIYVNLILLGLLLAVLLLRPRGLLPGRQAVAVR
jgi:branched-chain amino acid transport system permease protein